MELLIEEKKRINSKFFTIEELGKLNTKRLLSFYKRERSRYYGFISGRTCDCCGESMVNLYPDDKYYKNAIIIITQWGEYLSKIKNMLNKREHVK